MTESKTTNNTTLWLWRNGNSVLGYYDFKPAAPNGDPLVLGEPFGSVQTKDIITKMELEHD